ncbi:MAG: tetratricopeptide repeat protein [Aquificaceae bacterium]|nr:tetratricopeptide repeat protein [Aquificaceae bacterium]MCX8059713.1 tetratricopeptide repeat protein [Aquificaceae bacterium]MDW8097282.1 tetratricopeptide repeat protein [Aquificaceae bacterium]
MSKAVIVLAFPMLLLSCGGITKEEFDKRTASLEARIAQLEQKQKVLDERNLRTEGRLDNLSENLAGIRLELERLKFKGSASQESLSRIPEPRRESSPPRTQEVPRQESPAQREAPTSRAQERQEAQQQGVSDSVQKEYDEALRLYNLKQLHQAKDRFIDFIKKHPRTPLTDNAYLWLGVVYRELGETDKAEAVWLTLVERCQRKEMVDCNKASSALLQLARVQEQRGDSQKAREYYEAILKEYPLSEEASVARAKLGR